MTEHGEIKIGMQFSLLFEDQSLTQFNSRSRRMHGITSRPDCAVWYTIGGDHNATNTEIQEEE